MLSGAKPQLRVMVVIGTRPEGIKVAPVVQALEMDPAFECQLVLTGQHVQMVDQVLDAFGLVAARRLTIPAAGRSLEALTSACLAGISALMDEFEPHVVLVQGDTTTTMSAALVGFYRHVPVVHLEAGLRTRDLSAPHPEEGNRRITTQLADLHLAPTPAARCNLLADGVDARSIIVTGNTVIDALRWMATRVKPRQRSLASTTRTLLVTTHRRESWGPGVARIAAAIGTTAERYPDLEILMPLHMNPIVRDPLVEALRGFRNVELTEPLAYGEMVSALLGADIVLTDSGGLQEEAPSLSKPVLVMRDVTERPEAVAAGCARLTGTDPSAIVDAVADLLDDEVAYASMARCVNPYGDGQAAARVVQALAWRYLAGAPPVEFEPRPGA